MRAHTFVYVHTKKTGTVSKNKWAEMEKLISWFCQFSLYICIYVWWNIAPYPKIIPVLYVNKNAKQIS